MSKEILMICIILLYATLCSDPPHQKKKPKVCIARLKYVWSTSIPATN